jgi:methionyl aminopeptidase
MKYQNKNYGSEFIILQNEQWISDVRIAGKACAEIMILLENLIKDKTKLSLLDIDRFTEEEIIKRDCIPTFKNYRGFPNSLCVSINTGLVHGVPKEYYLKEGDLVSFDFGATFGEGNHKAIADNAITLIYGTPNSNEDVRLIETTKKCLENGINAIQIGKKIGIIGNAIYKTANNAGYKVIENYGGHGLTGLIDGENMPHGQPFICNRAYADDGVRFQNGMCIAIEPLLTKGDIKTSTDTIDKWTVSTEKLNAHWEHTILILDNKVEVITRRKNEIDI